MPGHLTVIKIAGTGNVAATDNSVSNIDIPEDGEILAISGFINGTGIDSDAKASAELSFLSTNQLDVNDARGSILEVAVRGGLVVSSGLCKASEHVTIGFPNGFGIPVAAGERVHLHTKGTTGVIAECVFMLYLNFSRGRPSSRRR